MIPTRRILDPIFGQPILRAANNGLAKWTQVNTSSQWQKGTGWQANLYGGVQTGDDWASMFVPVSELRIIDFNSALWSYYMTAAQTFGVNLVIWVHDPNDFSKRAEITQLANVVGLGKALGWNSHTLVKTTDQFFFYGEGTTGTGLTAGPANLYGWDDFQADALFKTWDIYRISLEYGWEASGTFDQVWVAELKVNGMQIPIKPGPDELLTRMGEVQATPSSYTLLRRLKDLLTGIVLATGTNIIGKVQDSFGGNVYSKTMTMADDNATRFETSAKKLRDVIIIVTTNNMLLGETGTEVYPVGADEIVGFTKVDISTLYFKNASAGSNGTITILGVEE